MINGLVGIGWVEGGRGGGVGRLGEGGMGWPAHLASAAGWSPAHINGQAAHIVHRQKIKALCRARYSMCQLGLSAEIGRFITAPGALGSLAGS